MKKSHVGILAAGFIVCFASLLLWGTSNITPAQGAEVKTGVGLAEHALKAYRQSWKYEYGCYGQFVNGVRRTDCSGLIKSYLWWTGDKTNPRPGLVSVAGGAGGMLASATARGNINLSKASSIPRIQGLCLYSPGHAGVYIGSNISVDNRCTGQNVKYQQVIGGRYHWTTWFELPQIRYPQKGFVTFDGNQYYYENGQYVVSTQRTFNGTVYTFDASGKLVSGDATSLLKSVSMAVEYQTRVLQKGMSGNDVLALQRKLTSLGYMTSDNCTGYFGSITKAALISYQRRTGLSQTGIADSNVMKTLNLKAV